MADIPHGTRSHYAAGCRCIPCRAANSQYQVQRAAETKSGERHGMVSAGKARKHLLALKRAGIGRQLVSEISGVSRTVIRDVRSGKQKVIRVSLERRILSVDAEAKNAASRVPAKPTWKRIDELVEEGFTEGELAKRLGCHCERIQLDRDFVTAKTEQKVARLYAQIMGDGE